jgi:effector-binding domain-containing protein
VVPTDELAPSGSLDDMSPTDLPQPEIVDAAPVATAVTSGTVPVAELADFFDRSFSTLAGVVSSQGVAITGPAFALYHGVPTETADLEVGFPTDRPVEAADGVEAGSLPGGRVARLVHQGSYEQLGSSWARLGSWIGEQALTPGGDMWEVYVTEPSPDMDPADLRTELNWPLPG